MPPLEYGMIQKPLLRGHFHQAAFFFSLGAGLMLILKSQNMTATLASSVYTFSLVFLFGTSSLYHRVNWETEKRKWMKRLDHSAIYILIAGTFSPICLLALPESTGKNLLITIWSVALLGVLQSLFYVQAPKWLSATLYLMAGYLILPFVMELKNSIGPINLAWLVCGGLAYTIGALCYAIKRPTLNPAIFGYHEVFHLLVIFGAICHFVVIYSVI